MGTVNTLEGEKSIHKVYVTDDRHDAVMLSVKVKATTSKMKDKAKAGILWPHATAE